MGCRMRSQNPQCIITIMVIFTSLAVVGCGEPHNLELLGFSLGDRMDSDDLPQKIAATGLDLNYSDQALVETFSVGGNLLLTLMEYPDQFLDSWKPVLREAWGLRAVQSTYMAQTPTSVIYVALFSYNESLELCMTKSSGDLISLDWMTSNLEHAEAVLDKLNKRYGSSQCVQFHNDSFPIEMCYWNEGEDYLFHYLSSDPATTGATHHFALLSWKRVQMNVANHRKALQSFLDENEIEEFWLDK